ncbi:cardiomyopathy-associated protein 5 isoform X1 [Pelobates fuscus]|uniref:cardiomyopathy-associated protein 5 isoform X1 n=1 Tax=Pelobates fuscus TaxID=191477 RepID=UPI002FE4DCFF
MESLLPSECDRASEISFCLDDEAPPDSVLNAEDKEELTQSLKDAIDVEDVKPKLQCLMSNPSFSMVTVQCEDSGIHWETSSSRCSTPWASEASTTSDVYSMDSSSVGTPGKVIFIMDEGKLRRKRARVSSQFSRHSLHPKKSVLSHQKEECAENMEQAVKGAIEKAKSQSFKLAERSNNLHDSSGISGGHEAFSPIVSSEETAIKRKKFVDSKIHKLKTVPEQNVDIKEKFLEESSSLSAAETASQVKSVPTVQLGSLNKKDFETVVSPLDETINILSEEFEQEKSNLSNSWVEANLTVIQSHKPSTDNLITEETVVQPLSADRLDTERSHTQNLTVLESLSTQPTSSLLYLTDKNESSNLESDNIKSDIVSRNDLPKEGLVDLPLCQPFAERIRETTVEIGQKTTDLHKISPSALEDEIKKQEVADIPTAGNLPTEDFDVSNNSLTQLATNNLKGEQLVSDNVNKHLPPEEQKSKHRESDTGSRKPLEKQPDIFSIVPEGSEMVNILEPHLVLSVDQEASNKMQDKLEYFNEKPKLSTKSSNQSDLSSIKPSVLRDTSLKGNREIRAQPGENANGLENMNKDTSENTKQLNPDKSTNEVDYFEKFTLVDDKIPIECGMGKPSLEAEMVNAKQETCYPTTEKEKFDEYDYYLENFDESFYGVTKSEDEFVNPIGNSLRESPSDGKENSKEDAVKPDVTTLFNAEEGVLSKSFYFPTSYPINPELLQEPPALAFLYEDLYEKATKDENNPSDEENNGSEGSFHSRISDDDGTGIYFEKYNLKDEIPFDKFKPHQRELTEQFYDLPPAEEVEYENAAQGKKHVEMFPPVGIQVYEQFSEEEEREKKPQEMIDIVEAILKEAKGKDVGSVNKDGLKAGVSQERESQNLESDIAKSLDFVVISQDDLDELDEELKFEDLGHDSDGEFEMVMDVGQGGPMDHGESGFEIIEHEKSSELSEPSLTDGKTAQIDTYCYTCKIPILAIDKIFGDHKDHDVTTIDNAVTEMTTNLEDLYDKLQENSLKTEDFVSRVEALFNDVEKIYTETEKVLQEQNEEMIQKVFAQHTAQRESFEGIKKIKLEYLQDQIVNFQKNIDLSKEILERTVQELEETDPVVFLSLHDEMNKRLMVALENMLSLDKMPNAKSLFEKCSGESTKEDVNTEKCAPAVPHTPKLKAQERSSATSTTITVYWSMSQEDVIDCFQVYCMEEPQGNRENNGLLEEYRVTVKESFCILEDLEPDKCYSVWVMAVNNTGCSFPSDRASFRTAPSTPVIKAEECTVCWDTAVIRWTTTHPEYTDSFTLEWCKQYSSEGEGLRSVSGVKGQQLKVSLQPNENYFFYVRATNSFGTSEQSEAALISTKGTRFHLLRDMAHPALDLSPDGTVISISEQSEISGIPLVLGELLPATGRHYWEMMVTGCSAYSVGATFQPSADESPFVEECTSWCMQCYSSSTSFSYKFLHNEVLGEVHLTEPPVRVGILLDYTTGRLSFYNVQKGNLLFTFRHRFTEAAHPTFALEAYGELHLHTGIELPRFAKDS